jgi:REP element-mobilizing transposase RayT
MARNWKNIYVEGAVHHVTGTVNQWLPVLLYTEITEIFYNELSLKMEIWQVKLIGYVIMPEHFHVLVQTDKGTNIEKFIHGLRRAISGRARFVIEHDNNFLQYCQSNNINRSLLFSNTASKSQFRFWKEKPRVFPLDREKDIVRMLTYIHNNPYRRGLVQNLEDWGHSSYRYYEYGEKGRVKVGIE